MVLVVGSILAGGVASAAGPAAQAEGRFLSGSVGGTDLSTLVSVAPASASAAPDATDVHPLSVSALQAVTVGLGTGVNLLGTNGILTLGAVNQYATAASAGSSRASAGAVDDTGAIGIGASGNANAGIAPSNATLNLASVIGAVPALQTALSATSVTVGAVAATADQTVAGVQSGSYKIGSLSLDLTSPLVAGVYTSVSSTLSTVQTTLDGLQALLGVLVTVNNIPDVTTLLAPLTNITSADGSITANLQTGAVHIDIRKITGLDLDNLAPNTNLLPAITNALTTQLVPAITDALTGAGGVVQTATTEISNITVTTILTGTTVPLSSGILNPILTSLTTPINSLVAGLGTNVITPLASALTGLVALTGNVQPNLPNTNASYSKAPLSLGVVPSGFVASVTLAKATVGPNAGPTVPTTASLSPDHGPIAGGNTVTITGSGFETGAGNTTVNVDGTAVPATVTSATSLTYTAPAHAKGNASVTVTTADGGTSTPALTYRYLGTPTATSLTPTGGPIAGGTTVTVTGSDFIANDTTVSIGGTTVTATVTSSTSLTFTTPPHAEGLVGVTVTTPGGTSTPALEYTYGPPTVTAGGLSPDHGPVAGGTTVTVTGTGFVPNSTTVKVDNVSVTPVVISDTSLTFTSPPHPVGTADITVVTNGGTSSPARPFRYVDTPTATSLTPDNGPVAGGTTVTVTGTDFVVGDTTVNLDGSPVTATVTSPTSLTFVTPPHGPGLVPVTVTTVGGTSAPALGFTFGPPTTAILGLSPDHGPAAGGTTVTVTGTGFVPGATSVKVDTVTVPANATSSTTLTFVTPAHAVGSADVSVVTAGGQSSPPLAFRYLGVPTATSLSPDHGPVAGGTTVTVTGSDFVDGDTTVSVDGTTITPTVTSTTSLTFVTLGHAPGLVGVTVSTAGGTSAPALPFTFGPPTISANGLNPDHGTTAGGTPVTVTGTGFVIDGTSVNVDGTSVPAVATSSTNLTFFTPPHAVGPVNVTVVTAGGESDPQSYRYVGQPTATSLTPAFGPVAGGTLVTVTGSDFVAGDTTVSLDGGTPISATVTSPTTLTFTTPPHAAGPVAVTVTTVGGTSSPALQFVFGPPTVTSLSPNHGPAPGGTSVTITGSGFVANGTTVTVDTTVVPAGSVTVTNNGTTATFLTPAHAVGPVNVTVGTAGGSSTPLLYQYDPPSATGITPNFGPVTGGTPVVITGTGFVPGQTSVSIGGAVVPAGSVTVGNGGTTASFDTPPNPAGQVDVSVTTPDGSTTPPLTFVYGPPNTGSLSPNHGPGAGGTSVTVTGSGFVQGGTTVTIDGTTIPTNQVTVSPDGTTATFSTPPHQAATVDVTVATAGGATTSPLPFTYDLPTAISVSPNNGPTAGGTSVTVTGTGFVPGDTQVVIGGVSLDATVGAGGTTATVTTLPHGPGAAGVTVTTPYGSTTPPLSFVFGPPTTVSLSPTHGLAAGGTIVTITGVGFVPGATSVTIGGLPVAAGQVTVNGPGTTATFTTPAHAVGPVTVTASTAGGTSTPGLAYTYDPPTATAISPNYGISAGGTTVTITGTGFVPNLTSVTIGGNTVTSAGVNVANGGTSLTFVTPPHADGGVPVTVTTPQATTTPPLGFLYGTDTLPVSSCVLTGSGAATVSVLADTGVPASGGVPSTFAVQYLGNTVGSTAVTPDFGGFLNASISVPVPVADNAIGVQVTYTLKPVASGVYPQVGPVTIDCTPITPTQQAAGAYHPLPPFRMLDTRYGNGSSQPIGPGGTLKVQVRGRGGVPALGQPLGKGVATVMLNVTTTDSVKAGYLTIYPGDTRPNASSINFAAKATVANLVAAAVAPDGTVTIYNGSVGATDVVADVQGYFSDGPTVAPGSFVPLSPSRILDTGNGTGAPQRAVPAGGSITIQATSIGGVPATNVAAVALNMTVDQPTSSGYITVYPTDPKPLVSSLNFYRGQTDANLVIAPVAPDGTVTIYNGSTGSVRLIADVSGFFRGGTAILDGEFVPVSPGRLLDTRIGTNVSGKVGAQKGIAPTVLGRNRIPATGVSAVVSNLTVTNAAGAGFITAYPQGTLPLASNLNFVAHQDRPNAVIARVGSDGKLRLYNGAVTSSVDLVADVSGYFISNPLP